MSKKRPAGRARGGGVPASRLALFGGLGLIAILILSALVCALVSPDTARALLAGKPTPLPPTPRPTATPSPVPTATPVWDAHAGGGESFTIDLPPYWVVIDFSAPIWERTVRWHSLHYSWLEARLPTDEQQRAVAEQAIWAFDPRGQGTLSVHCWLEPALAGMTVSELQDTVGQMLLTQGKGGVRTESAPVADRMAAVFEFVVRPDSSADVDESSLHRTYVLADDEQAFWIEVVGLESEVQQNALQIQAMIDSFDITARGERLDD